MKDKLLDFLIKIIQNSGDEIQAILINLVNSFRDANKNTTVRIKK